MIKHIAESLVCHRCGCEEYETTISGKHVKASCKTCGAFLKFLRQDRTGTNLSLVYSPFKRHKGLSVAHVAQIDPAYLFWIKDTMKGYWKEMAEMAIEKYGLERGTL